MATDTFQAEVPKPPSTQVGVLGWLRRNLFSNLFNSLFTIIGAVVTFFFLRTVITWAVFLPTGHP
jgi:general L-amino acid transport system permease protein